jgi:acyl-coenzyme A thioesterase 13
MSAISAMLPSVLRLRFIGRHVRAAWMSSAPDRAPSAPATPAQLPVPASTPAPLGGFMARCAALGAQALLGVFIHTGNRFDRTLEGLEVVSVGSGKVTCSLVVAASHSNSYGTLHGGCTATMVDIVGTMAALCVDPLRPGVSVDMHISYLAAARVGERVTIVGTCLKMGGRLAFTEVKIYLGNEGGKLVAMGSHTKAL